MSPKEKNNNHDEKAAARRKSIIDVAVKLFSEKDFHDVRIDDIAEEVGLAKGTIYLYFENKDQLFFSIIVERTEMLQASLQHTLNHDERFIPCLKQFIMNFIAWFDDHEPFFKIMYSDKLRMSGETHQRMRDYKQEVFRGIFSLTQKMIQKGQEQHVIQSVSPIDLSKVLLGILNSFLFHRILLGFKIPIEEEVEKIINYFMNGARADSSSQPERVS